MSVCLLSGFLLVLGVCFLQVFGVFFSIFTFDVVFFFFPPSVSNSGQFLGVFD